MYCGHLTRPPGPLPLRASLAEVSLTALARAIAMASGVDYLVSAPAERLCRGWEVVEAVVDVVLVWEWSLR